MREIKFRAWDKAFSRMVYSVNHKIVYPDPVDGLKFWVTNFSGRWTTIGYTGTVMQYTGLKDKNGKEIYEGDIIKGNRGNFQVVFCNGAFMVKHVKENAIQLLFTFLISNGEKVVVGNIYEKVEDNQIPESKELCPNCNMPIAKRNPSGKCDHLYYPDNVPKKAEPPNVVKRKCDVCGKDVSECSSYNTCHSCIKKCFIQRADGMAIISEDEIVKIIDNMLSENRDGFLPTNEIAQAIVKRVNNGLL